MMSANQTLRAATVFVLLLTATLWAQAAEFTNIPYTKTRNGTLSETKIYPGDLPGHELVQAVHSDTLRSSYADFNNVEERVFNQEESVGGNGTHRGMAVDYLKSGDQVFMTFDGSHRTTVKDGGAWEVTYSGKFDVVGGTGKYKNAKGKGTYRGKVTPEGGMQEEGVYETLKY